MNSSDFRYSLEYCLLVPFFSSALHSADVAACLRFAEPKCMIYNKYTHKELTASIEPSWNNERVLVASRAQRE